MTLPRFITCQRPGCGRIREVRRPCDQRTAKYCSRQCAARMLCNILHAQQQRAVQRSVATRKRKVLTRVAGLTPLEAFKAGYKAGLQSKCSYLRKRYVLTKKVA